MSVLTPVGMDSAGLNKIAQSGDTYNVLQSTSTAIQKGNGTGGLTPATAGADYQSAISFSTTGSSGVATFSAGALNIPNYAGTVSTVSVASTNGFTGTVANATTTPAITLATSITGLLKGNGTAISAAVQGTDYTNTIFSSTATKTVTNTTTETSAIGTGVGSQTLAANFFTAGRTLRISGSGIYSAAAVAPGNLTVKIKLGSTIIATTTLGSLLSGASSLGYQFEAEIVCRTTGSTGTVMTSGSIDYASTSSGTRLFGDLNNGGATSTIDTTSTQLLDVTVTWQTASTSNIVSNTIAVIEVLW